MDRYLFFANGSNEGDVLCLPVSQIEGMEIGGNTAVNIFANDLGGDDTNDLIVTVNCTAGKTKEVMEAIIEAANFSVDPFVVVADDINSEFLSADITSCGEITEQA
jgi:hypothetical protein